MARIALKMLWQRNEVWKKDKKGFLKFRNLKIESSLFDLDRLQIVKICEYSWRD